MINVAYDTKNSTFVLLLFVLEGKALNKTVAMATTNSLSIRDGPLFFYREGYHFWDLQTIFFKE